MRPKAPVSRETNLALPQLPLPQAPGVKQDIKEVLSTRFLYYELGLWSQIHVRPPAPEKRE